MRRFSREDRKNIRQMRTTEEVVAFEEFCGQLKEAVENYVEPASASDASHRSRRALNFLTSVAGAMSEVLLEETLRN